MDELFFATGQAFLDAYPAEDQFRFRMADARDRLDGLKEVSNHFGLLNFGKTVRDEADH